MEWTQPKVVAKDDDPTVHCPTPRSGHTLSLLGSNVYLFGGLVPSSTSTSTSTSNSHVDATPTNQLYCLRRRTSHSSDGQCYEWSRVDSDVLGDNKNAVPPPRWRHSATKISPTEFLVFGGYSRSPLDRRYNDVWIFNAITCKWRQPLVKSSSDKNDGIYEPPSPRGAHSAVACNDKVIVIGGLGGSGSELDHLEDVLSLDINTWEWNVIEARGQGPGRRSGHVACVVDHNIIVHGGVNAQGHCGGDLFLLNLQDYSAPTWTKIDAGLPSRFFHACASVGTSNMLIFGGCSESKESCLGAFFGDTQVIGIDAAASQICRKELVTPTCDIMEPRSDTAMVIDPEQRLLFLFGGYSHEWYGDVHTLDICRYLSPY